MTLRLICLFSIVHLLRLGRCQSRLILGYDEKSCETLEPSYIVEDYSHINLGIKKDTEEAKSNTELRQRNPTRYNARNPPVELKIDFDQYRRNREYTIRLVASRLFDGYMLQVQGNKDGNVTYVGSWKSSQNKMSRLITCNGAGQSSLLSKRRPVQYGNSSFTWRAPSDNAGPLRIYASIIFQDAYFVLQSREISFNTYPLSLKGCGEMMSCFRYCVTEPFCSSDETQYMVTISEDPIRQGSVLFTLGGKINGPESYIGIGFGYDDQNLQNLDIVVCFANEGEAIQLEHYLLENKESTPLVHRSKIALTSSDYDKEAGYIWCQFRRPINPESSLDVDFASNLYRFYFWGERNGTEILLPSQNRIYSSPLSLNISDQVNEVEFNGGKSSGKTLLSPELLIHLIMIVFVFIGI